MTDGQHSGTVALVSGANKGIGRQIVRRLAAEGMTVYLGARNETLGRAAERELAGPGADVRFTQLDVTDQAQVDAAVKRVEEEFGRLDVLVNNAGISVDLSLGLDEYTADHLREVYEVNVFGVVALTRACLPLLRRSSGARVVNLSSPLGSLGLLSEPDNPISTMPFLAYNTSKAALNAITVMYANGLREAGIPVNAVSPGLVATDLNGLRVGERGARTVAEGAEAPVRMALMGGDGPTGEFRGGNDSVDESYPW